MVQALFRNPLLEVRFELRLSYCYRRVAYRCSVYTSCFKNLSTQVRVRIHITCFHRQPEGLTQVNLRTHIPLRHAPIDNVKREDVVLTVEDYLILFSLGQIDFTEWNRGFSYVHTQRTLLVFEALVAIVEQVLIAFAFIEPEVYERRDPLILGVLIRYARLIVVDKYLRGNVQLARRKPCKDALCNFHIEPFDIITARYAVQEFFAHFGSYELRVHIRSIHAHLVLDALFNLRVELVVKESTRVFVFFVAYDAAPPLGVDLKVEKSEIV